MPFTFPVKSEEFYSYSLDSNKITPDNILNDLQEGEPFLKEFCLPGSGHPQGYLYGWVANDNENLYVALDVTSDNTLDGDKDYAKININTDNGIKVFDITQSKTSWGKTSFVYTDKVEYEHKIYEFIIPLDEVNVENNTIHLSFAVYGTLSDPINFEPNQIEVSEDVGTVNILIKRPAGGHENYPGDITLYYHTEDGTAKSGRDYTYISDQITFKEGDTEYSISIDIISDDNADDDDEYEDFFLTFNTENGHYNDGAIATIVIIDDDDEDIPPTPTFRFSESEYTVNESEEYAEITVEYDSGESEAIPTFMASSNNIVVIGFSTVDDTATDGLDYTGVSETLNFDGKNKITVNIPIMPDDIDEDDEKVILRLFPVYYRRDSNEEPIIEATLTIIDDDGTTDPPVDPPVDPDPKPEPKPDREPKPKPPTGEVIIRKPDYIEIGKPVEKYPLNKDEVTVSYNQKRLNENGGDVPVVCYWNTKYDKWVALTTYEFEEGKVKALLDGEYKGWFKVYANGQPKFLDIDNDMNEYLYIRLNNLGILEGFVEGDIDSRIALVEQDITRNEFATFVYRMINIDEDNVIIPILASIDAEKILAEKFIDSNEIMPWNRLIIANLAAEDIVESIDGYFNGTHGITTLEAAKIVNNAIKLIPDYKKIDFDNFKEDANVGEWAKVALEDKTLDEHIESNVGLDNTISREEALVILYKLFILSVGW